MLSNWTLPVCNTSRTISDGEEQQTAQAETKLDGTTKRVADIFQVQHSTTLNINPAEYQNVYRITIKNSHSQYQNIPNAFKKDYSIPAATSWHGILTACNNMSRLADANIRNCMLPVA